MFTRVDEIGWKQSNLFKQTFSVDVKIEFIGVWYVFTFAPPTLLTASSFDMFDKWLGIPSTLSD